MGFVSEVLKPLACTSVPDEWASSSPGPCPFIRAMMSWQMTLRRAVILLLLGCGYSRKRNLGVFLSTAIFY